MRKNENIKHIIGIDEVGRGPLAGPVAVGAVFIYTEYYRRVSRLFPTVKDSKKLSSKAREAWLVKIDKARSEGWLEYAVIFVQPNVIDKKGIALATLTALARALKKFDGVSYGGAYGGATSIWMIHWSSLMGGFARQRAIKTRRLL
ncbi:MAG: hypothetical protein HY228_02045 [Candidatus Yonathbacteria bacterium]|nr:hypothetical protein [Candidatus Yonathbacteria bacterium]